MEKVEIDTALALIKNDEGKVLAQLRNDPSFVKAHNKWELPGGKVDPGETYEQAVVREAKEETGFDVEIVDQFGEPRLEIDSDDKGTEYYVTLVYFNCKIVGGKLYDPAVDPKVFEARFFSAEELSSLEWGLEYDKEAAIEFSKQ